MDDKQLALVTEMVRIITALIVLIFKIIKAKDEPKSRKHHKHKR